MGELSHVGMTNCYFCGQGKDVVLDRRLKKSLPRFVGVVDMEPCNECKEWMKKGVILMSISNDTTDEEMRNTPPNPYRTGGWTVVKDHVIPKMFKPQSMVDWVLKHRFAFIIDEAWDAMGIPRGDEDEKREST